VNVMHQGEWFLVGYADGKKFYAGEVGGVVQWSAFMTQAHRFSNEDQVIAFLNKRKRKHGSQTLVPYIYTASCYPTQL